MRNFIYYFIGGISLKLVTFLLLPLMTTVYTIEEIGLFSILELTAILFGLVIDLQVSSAINRYYNSKDICKNELIQSIILIKLITFIFILGIVYMTNINSDIFGKYSDYIELVIISQFLFVSLLSFFNLFRQQFNANAYLHFSVLYSLVFLISTYILIKNLYGIESYFYGQIISSLVTITLIIIKYKYYIHDYQFILSYKLTKKLLKYSLPLVASQFAFMLIISSDRYIIEYFLSLSLVAVYTMNVKIVSVIQIGLIAPFRSIWVPFVFKNINKQRLLLKMVDNMLSIYISIILLLAIILNQFYNIFVIWFLNDNYLLDSSIFLLIYFSIAMFGVLTITSVNFHILEETFKLSVAFVLAGLLNILLSICLVQYYGVIGISIAMILSMSFLCILFILYGVSNKMLRIKKDILILIILYFIFYIFKNNSVVTYVIAIGAIFIIVKQRSYYVFKYLR